MIATEPVFNVSRYNYNMLGNVISDECKKVHILVARVKCINFARAVLYEIYPELKNKKQL